MDRPEPNMRRGPGRPPKMSGRPFTQFSVSLAPDTIERLQQEARAQGEDSASAIVRRAIGDYLRRLDKRRDRVDA